ncbi:unnamed protein product [Amaranthus hypochondriacus]
MAISRSHQCLPPFSDPCSSSFSLSLKPQNTHFLSFIKPIKFRVFCSQNTIQTETHKSQHLSIDYEFKKKKRKPKPSFSDQIREKWSVKPISQTKKFPWQIQQEEDEEEPSYSFSEVSLETVQTQKRELTPQVENPEISSISNSKIEEPRIVFDRNLNQSLSNTVSEPLNSALDNTNLIDTFHNGNRKQYNVEEFCGNSVEILASEKLVECEVDVKEKEDIKVTLSSRKYDSNSVNCSDNVWENVAPYRISSSNYDNGSTNSWKVKSSSENFAQGKSRDSLPWIPEAESEKSEEKSKTILAEKTIPEHELKRLRNLALRMKERLKVGAAGVTQALVDAIHEKWKIDEVVKLKFESQSGFNMKRIHDVLENKTGGLVIWRSGSSVVLFRGLNYKLDCVKTYIEEKTENLNVLTYPQIHMPDSMRLQKKWSEEESEEIRELNRLLDALGPRYVDWSGPPPLPVDADLLPATVPGYKTPFRLLPYGVRRGLRDEETTGLRRTARITHPHFALGRSRELQGLAAAIVKLWAKSAIAKIAIKRGVLNTCNERMAEELKRLTGGTLLSRNKEYIVLYRGNDFLPPNVTVSLKERERLTVLQYEEEEERRSALTLVKSNSKNCKVPMVAGTLAETVAATSRWGKQPSNEAVEKMLKDSALARRASLVTYLNNKLAIANAKLKKAEKALEKVQGYLEPEDLPTDLETITDEERLVFRKMGLSMKPYLLVGRREVFDGTIENIHLHWKFRELVKVIVKGKTFAQVKHLAISLEAESSGVLVSIDKTTKGYAIIIYRGKNYRQPIKLRPRNLLTRRQALARSIELQRREGLKHHISNLQEQMELLISELEEMKDGKEIDDKTFYEKLDNSFILSDDEMEEDEDEEAYLQTYVSGDENGAYLEAELSQDEN